MNLKDVKIEKVLFDGKPINIFHIFIRPDEYSIALEAADNMWCSKNKGYLNTNQDPKKTERIGRLGEVAFGKIFNLSIDMEYKEYGDTMDFFLNQNKINVKCASKYPEYEAGLVRMCNNDGREVELKQDLYVFGYLKNENKQLKQANVVLVGYQQVDFIKKLEKRNAKIGNHYNYEVPYSSLIDINQI